MSFLLILLVFFFLEVFYIFSANFKFSKQMIIALSSAILTSFIFGGVALTWIGIDGSYEDLSI